MEMPGNLQQVAASNTAVKLGVRPEYLRLAEEGAGGSVAALVQKVQDMGTHHMLTAVADAQPLKVRLATGSNLPRVGDTVWLQLVNPNTCYYGNEELIP